MKIQIDEMDYELDFETATQKGLLKKLSYKIGSRFKDVSVFGHNATYILTGFYIKGVRHAALVCLTDGIFYTDAVKIDDKDVLSHSEWKSVCGETPEDFVQI